MSRRAFIVGGTGQIGHALADELLDHGWQVTLSSRGLTPPADALIMRGARIVPLDREQPGALAEAIADGADAVIDTIAYSQAHADQLLTLQSEVGAFIVISSSSVYRDDAGRTLDDAKQIGFPHFPQAITEKQPTIAPGPRTYSSRKAALERRLLDHARSPVTILRPGAIHGPHSSHPREWWFVKRMLDGRTVIPLAYRGQSRFHTAAAANIARLIRIAIDERGTRILNAADPVAPTTLEIGTTIARHMNYRGDILPLDLGDEKGDAVIGWSPWSVPRPFVLSTEAASALGYTPATTYSAAAAATCRWLARVGDCDWKQEFPVLANYPGDLFDYAGEDRFLKKASAGL